MKTFLLFLFFIPIIGTTQVTLDWLEFTGGVAIATDATDNVYTVNWDYNPAGDISLTKLDADGLFPLT